MASPTQLQRSSLLKSGGGCFFCCSTVLTGIAITGIVIGILGLKGGMSLRAVSITSIATGIPFANLLQVIFGILGVGGSVSIRVVSGVMIGFSVLHLTIAATLTCAGGVLCVGGMRSPRT